MTGKHFDKSFKRTLNENQLCPIKIHQLSMSKILSGLKKLVSLSSLKSKDIDILNVWLIL
jgi:hypothetical protein